MVYIALMYVHEHSTLTRHFNLWKITHYTSLVEFRETFDYVVNVMSIQTSHPHWSSVFYFISFFLAYFFLRIPSILFFFFFFCHWSYFQSTSLHPDTPHSHSIIITLNWRLSMASFIFLYRTRAFSGTKSVTILCSPTLYISFAFQLSFWDNVQIYFVDVCIIIYLYTFVFKLSFISSHFSSQIKAAKQNKKKKNIK